MAKEVFDWAAREAAEKKQQDFSKVEFFSWEESICVQRMHISPYDDEPATVAGMEQYAKAQVDQEDFGENRFHHEIYLSDVRRCKPEHLKTVIRHPIDRNRPFPYHTQKNTPHSPTSRRDKPGGWSALSRCVTCNLRIKPYNRKL